MSKEEDWGWRKETIVRTSCLPNLMFGQPSDIARTVILRNATGRYAIANSQCFTV